MLDLMLVPVLLGLAYAAAPGVVNAECLRSGFSRGFRPAFLVQAGALAGDAAWAIAAFSGMAALSRSRSLLDTLGIVGGLYLCKLAFDAVRSALRSPIAPTAIARGRPFRTGLIFGLANPAALAFWSGVGGGVLASQSQRGMADLSAFLLAFLLGALVWGVGFSLLSSLGARVARPGLLRAIDGVCGAVLGYFGVRLVWTSARRFLRLV